MRQILELAELDPDPVMARAVVIELLRIPDLIDVLFDLVARSRLLTGAQETVRHQSITRLYLREGLTAEVLERCVNEGDHALHERLLEAGDLPRPALEALAVHGANRAIRNRASALLRRRGERSS